jgi:hypothetical protein
MKNKPLLFTFIFILIAINDPVIEDEVMARQTEVIIEDNLIGKTSYIVIEDEVMAK